MNSVLNFTINDFNGPLDLLLHLVKESKMDIYEVPLEKIIKDYIAFIHEMENMNIDVASEYLVMASELIHLKSKMLININDSSEEDEDELGINSEDELRRRLSEYEQYKKVSEDFKFLEEKRGEVYTKIPDSLSEYKEEIKLSSDISLDDLVNAFETFLERQKYIKPLSTKITKKELSVERRTSEIRNILVKHKKVDFFDLFDTLTRPYLVVTFLSILEMTKNNEINIKQEQNFGNIMIEMK